MKVLTVIGTRPEAIKMAPVIKAIQDNKLLEGELCVTGQHREMLDQVLQTFELVPDVDLDLMRGNQDLASIFGRIVDNVSQVLTRSQPDVVMVHGDTATTLASSLAAYFHQIPVAHVEAGLRTGNIYAPWPEEINRKMTAAVSRWNFAPTERARNNLLNEGVAADTIHVVGNTVIDALLQVIEKIESDEQLQQGLTKRFDYLDSDRRLLLVTGHRRENFGEGFKNICQAIKLLSTRDDIQIIYPVHLNPAVHDVVHEELSGSDNVHLIEPVNYLEMAFLMMRAELLLTDSGGIQEEAPALAKPVLVMRETTERPEALEAGTARLCGTNQDDIVQAVSELLDDPKAYQAMARSTNPYGDGLSSGRIVSILAGHAGQ